jgi:hypothetical protein
MRRRRAHATRAHRRRALISSEVGGCGLARSRCCPSTLERATITLVPLCPQCHGFVPTGTRVCPTCHALQPTSPPPREATLGPGGTLDVGYGRIVIDSRIGEGGMGIVWRAWLFWAPASGRAHEPPAPIALKVLHPRARGRAELRAFFVSEAEALKQLSHPNIVRFHALIEQGPLLAIAMEYVDGDTLEEVIARQVARAKRSSSTGGAWGRNARMGGGALST